MILHSSCRSFSGLLLFLLLCLGCATKPNPASHAGGGGTAPKESQPGDQKRTAVAPPPPVKREPPRVFMHAPVPAAPPSETPAVDPEVAWYSKLQTGLLKQYVPPTMKWKFSSTVTVVVGGEKSDPSTALPSATGSSTIKVSRQMRVMVICPDNPDEFTIAAEPGTTDVQYVPEDGATTWNYSVTPKYTGKNQKIAIRAWVIYPGSTNADHELPVYTAVVNVAVPSIGECIKRLVEGDPDYWLKYGLPGGAGFAALVTLFGIIRKLLRKKRSGTAAEPVGS